MPRTRAWHRSYLHVGTRKYDTGTVLYSIIQYDTGRYSVPEKRTKGYFGQELDKRLLLPPFDVLHFTRVLP